MALIAWDSTRWADGGGGHVPWVRAYAIGQAHTDVAPYLAVASATEPLPGRYDLVTCIEVLEHMPADEAERAMDAMTAAADDILFSSSPTDHVEPHPVVPALHQQMLPGLSAQAAQQGSAEIEPDRFKRRLKLLVRQCPHGQDARIEEAAGVAVREH